MPLGVEAFTCLRQFLTYLAVTITLAMICFDLRFKSKTVFNDLGHFVCYFKGE